MNKNHDTVLCKAGMEMLGLQSLGNTEEIFANEASWRFSYICQEKCFPGSKPSYPQQPKTILAVRICSTFAVPRAHFSCQ